MLYSVRKLAKGNNCSCIPEGKQAACGKLNLTSIAGKSMEGIIPICAHIQKFCDQHQIISLQQHGLLPGRSIATNLLSCINDCIQLGGQGLPVDVIYLDFAKAFVRVPVDF